MCVHLYRPYCTRYNVCTSVPSLLHPIQCVYICTVPIAPHTMCTTVRSLLHPIKCVYVCTPLSSPLHPIQYVYIYTVPIAPDTMCVHLYRSYCTWWNVSSHGIWSLLSVRPIQERLYCSDLHDIKYFFPFVLWSGDTSSLRNVETELNGVGVKLIGKAKCYTADMWLLKNTEMYLHENSVFFCIHEN